MANSISRFNPNPSTGMVASSFTPSDAFTSEDKTETNHFFHETSDESVLAGVWQCAPCKETFEAYPVNELMTILEGSVTVTAQGESPETFITGDTFFIPKGTACVWEITKTLRKYYMISD